MHGPVRLLALLLGLQLAVACATTRIVDSWTAPGLVPSDLAFSHVVAIAVVPEEVQQRIAEDALAASISRTKVTPAYTLVTREDRAGVDRLRAELEEHGIDGAVTVRLVAVEDTQTYVPGTTRVYPDGYYGYYGHVVHEPGYTRTDTKVKIETSLHDVVEGRLLWAGVSETLNPSSVDALIAEVVKAAGEELATTGLLP